MLDGRVTHLADLMHRAESSNGSAISSNWILSTDGTKRVRWRPESAGSASLSYGSNANDIGNPSAAGASSAVSRADHVHRGVRSITANGSNSLFGNVNLQAGVGIALGVASQTITVTNIAGGTSGGGGGGSGAPTTAEYLVTAADGTLSNEKVVDLGAYTLLTRRAAANTEDDHFDAGTLDAKWLAYTGADIASVDLTTLPGWVGLNDEGHKLQAVPVGDWTIEAEVLSPTWTAAGFVGAQLIVTNGTTATSATDVRYIFGANNSLTVNRVNVSRFINNAFSATITDYTFTTPRDRMFIRLRKSGTNYAWDWSEAGKTWHQFGSTGALGLTPTHFGFGGTAGAFLNYFLRY